MGAMAQPGMPPESPSYLAATYNAGQGMLTFNYKRAVTPNLVNIGASLECSPMTLESQVNVGAEFNLTRSKMNVLLMVPVGFKACWKLSWDAIQAVLLLILL